MDEPSAHIDRSLVQDLLRRLPGVDALLLHPTITQALEQHPRKLVIESIRQVIEARRKRILENPGEAAQISLALDDLAAHILERVSDLSDFTLKTVVNATGIIVHTNLGRSLLTEEAVQRLQALCRSYNNLEYDIQRGQRGSRYVHAECLLCELTGAEAALVVNNNAGAVLLVLNTLASGREVVVSRGQLVEIGGSFRIPDVMRASGAILRDVGCTNRTHPRDYEEAINEETAILMKVHTSNYRIVGFTAEVSLADLVALGKKHGLPVVEDLGSGSFLDFSPYGLRGEPTVQETVRAGADVVTFSGDKLLGGPQAGIIIGKQDLIARCRKNPLTRALRVDKMTLAALEATLQLYRDERFAIERIPTLRMIAAPLSSLEARAGNLVRMLRSAVPSQSFHFDLQPGFSQVGGGSLPAQDLHTWLVAAHSEHIGTSRLEAALRRGRPPIIGRIESDRLLMDVRTLQPGDDEIIREAFAALGAGMN